MPRARLNGHLIAESEQTVMVEGNHYFPRDALVDAFFSPSPKTTVCGWKGTAEYFDITVDGQTEQAAAWTYRDPRPAALEIKDHVAFWGKVQVEP